MLSPTIKNAAAIFLTIALLTTTSQASEQPSHFYAGVGLSNIAAEEGGVSSRETGFTLLGGYSYSKYLSTEVALFNLGEHDELAMKGNGITLSVIGSYPVLDKLNLFAEFGLMSVNIAIDESQKISPSATEEDLVEDGIDSSIYFGLGAQYQFNDWRLVLKTTVADLDADMNILSAQVHYHF